MLSNKAPANFFESEAFRQVTRVVERLLDPTKYESARAVLPTRIHGWMGYPNNSICILVKVDDRDTLFIVRPENDTLIVESKNLGEQRLLSLYSVTLTVGYALPLDLLPDREGYNHPSAHSQYVLVSVLEMARNAFA